MFFFRTISSLRHEGLGDQRVHVTPEINAAVSAVLGFGLHIHGEF
jgi:hypothetical protein